VKQLKADSKFLSDVGLMDYSLLIGIYERKADPRSDDHLKRSLGAFAADESMSVSSEHDQKTELQPDDDLPQYDQWGIVSRDQATGGIERIYFLGIIDYLQKYNWVKKTEHFIKSIRYDRFSMSAVNPAQYAERFLNFVTSHIK